MDAVTLQVARRTGLQPSRVAGCCKLLADGNTVPFIARYRKEATGGMDEVEIRSVEDALTQLSALEARKKTVLAAIEKLGKLTEELRSRIEACFDRQELEDIYLPFKQRRSTRADAARQAGLEPLARMMLGLEPPAAASRIECARRFVSPATQPAGPDAGPAGAVDADAALSGARDIVADLLATHPPTRQRLRDFAAARGRMVSRRKRGAGEDAATFGDYFDHEEPVASAAPHRVLAMLRGEERGALTLAVAVPDAAGMDIAERDFSARVPPMFRNDFREASSDGWQRLLWPAVEREVLATLKEKADRASVTVFEQNLRSLLMAPPARGLRVIGVDPGFRNGCKLACVDATGAVLATATIYPLEPQARQRESADTLLALHRAHRFTVAGVGDGTGHREAMAFLAAIPWPSPVEVVDVREAGASVYSASPLAGRELPDMDVTLRSAVSIARRFQDPLAELVKIEPRAIGVGQYQHDVDQKMLERGLSSVVEECVNRVGVEINSASPELLSYVAGIGPTTSRAIVEHRNRKGAFTRRQDLLSVSGVGPSRFEQAAGFLRVADGPEPLDATGIHPERYPAVRRALALAETGLRDVLGKQDAVDRLRGTVQPEQLELGPATWADILTELSKPGRDPRGERVAFQFGDVSSVDDLQEGMVLPGRVTNITDFGAFVDIGVHRDGLVHISRLADRRVTSPFEVCKPGQVVQVKVVGVDRERNRISLTMRPSDIN